MAIFRPGALLSGLSGTIGGATFSRGRGSPIVSSRRRPAAGLASSTQARRTRQSLARSWYESLDQATRDYWAQLLRDRPETNRLGDSRPLTVYQAISRAIFAWPRPGTYIATLGTTTTVSPIPSTPPEDFLPVQAEPTTLDEFSFFAPGLPRVQFAAAGTYTWAKFYFGIVGLANLPGAPRAWLYGTTATIAPTPSVYTAVDQALTHVTTRGSWIEVAYQQCDPDYLPSPWFRFRYQITHPNA